MVVLNPMRKAIIHIGMHKTGTTAIQSAFAGFSDYHFAMSCFSPGDHNYPLMMLFIDNVLENLLVRRHGVTAGNLAGVRAHFAALLD